MRLSVFIYFNHILSSEDLIILKQYTYVHTYIYTYTCNNNVLHGCSWKSQSSNNQIWVRHIRHSCLNLRIAKSKMFWKEIFILVMEVNVSNIVNHSTMISLIYALLWPKKLENNETRQCMCDSELIIVMFEWLFRCYCSSMTKKGN